MRAEVENDHTTVDFLRFGGGTGVLTVEWEQRWIRCRESECAVVWSAPLLWTQRVASLTVDREYAVAQTERPDRETIRLTMRRLGLVDPLTQEVDDAPVGTARRVVGPDTVETYHWDSSVYTLAARRQVVPGVVIAGEFDLLTQETVDLIHRALSKMFQQSDGSFDDAGLWVAEAEFGGGYHRLRGRRISSGGTWYRAPHGAAHNKRLFPVLNGLPRGAKIAALLGAEDAPRCRLTVQCYGFVGIELLSRIELPCTTNLTRLAWIDVTGDEDDEWLFLTVPPIHESVETGAGPQRLHIYRRCVDGDCSAGRRAQRL